MIHPNKGKSRYRMDGTGRYILPQIVSSSHRRLPPLAHRKVQDDTAISCAIVLRYRKILAPGTRTDGL
jgi:hypothetical protein